MLTNFDELKQLCKHERAKIPLQQRESLIKSNENLLIRVVVIKVLLQAIESLCFHRMAKSSVKTLFHVYVKKTGHEVTSTSSILWFTYLDNYALVETSVINISYNFILAFQIMFIDDLQSLYYLLKKYDKH